MITVITGLPGAGKTLFAVNELRGQTRPVFYSGVADVKIPGWTELADPEKWNECPAGSIVLIDEAQRVFRPKMGGVVPAHMEALETHRHLGVDLVLVTQHPMLLHLNVRRLSNRHVHLFRLFGSQKSRVFQWATVQERCDKDQAGAEPTFFAFPRDVFSLYKSAELHTVKRRIPPIIFAVIGLPLVVVALFVAAFAYKPGVKDAPKATAQPAGAMAGVLPRPGVSSEPVGQPPGRPVLTSAQYVEQFAPRVSGLHYTAPAYDGLTAPTEAPYPAACVSSATRCACYTQQGTVLDVGDALCAQIVSKGFFLPWKRVVPDTPPLSKPGVSDGAPSPAAAGRQL